MKILNRCQALLFCTVGALLHGCRPANEGGVAPAATPTPGAYSAGRDVPTTGALPFGFHNVAREAGLRFRHNNGAFGERLLPETMGAGAALFDYDNDGWTDIFLVNGRDWTNQEIRAYGQRPLNGMEREFLKDKGWRGKNRPLAKPRPYRRTVGALYRNKGDGTFQDVTKGSNLDVEMLGMGAACADYDNDGRTDLLITAYRRLYLFHNQSEKGKARFEEVAAAAGVRGDDWNTCAAFLDYDKDGQVDLFVGNYLGWSPANDAFTTLIPNRKSYGWPVLFPERPSLLFRNVGKGRFRDVSAQAGIAVRGKSSQKIGGRALGVVVTDVNKDDWPDLVVANDMSPTFLFINQRNGKFAEKAGEHGIALSSLGKPRGGMGICAADIDGSGNESVAIGNFNAQMLGLYYNFGGGNFTDIAPHSSLGSITNWFLTFGVRFADFNNDGKPDLLLANGHVDPDIDIIGPGVGYAERPLLFLNESTAPGDPILRNVSAQAGPALSKKMVARGLGTADFDLDGDLDVLLTVNGAEPRLWRNDGGNQNNAVRLHLEGAKTNRSALGVRVEAHIGTARHRQTARSGSSYLTESEFPLTIGMGAATKIDALHLHWPSGQKTRLTNLNANRIYFIHESRGLLRQTPFPGRANSQQHAK